jgi:hypothetical protein
MKTSAKRPCDEADEWNKKKHDQQRFHGKRCKGQIIMVE